MPSGSCVDHPLSSRDQGPGKDSSSLGGMRGDLENRKCFPDLSGCVVVTSSIPDSGADRKLGSPNC